MAISLMCIPRLGHAELHSLEIFYLGYGITLHTLYCSIQILYCFLQISN